jgi:hypothetical protein
MPRKHYTHLLPPDAELLASYLLSRPDHYDHLDFDVKVGRGNDPGPSFPSNIRRMATLLSQRRIDCVAFTDDRIDIIEVTLQAGLTSLGQLVAYPRLYVNTFNPDRIVYPVLVTYAFAPDIKTIYDDHGIEYHVMPRPSRSDPEQHKDSGPENGIP